MKRSPANSAASSPPAPARISTSTFLSSLGSRSTIARRISSASSSSRAGRVGDDALELGVVGVLGDHLAGAGEVVGERRVLGRELAGGLQGPVLAPDLGVALAVGDHVRVRHLTLELGEAILDLGDELVDHHAKCD